MHGRAAYVRGWLFTKQVVSFLRASPWVLLLDQIYHGYVYLNCAGRFLTVGVHAVLQLAGGIVHCLKCLAGHATTCRNFAARCTSVQMSQLSDLYSDHAPSHLHKACPSTGYDKG